MKSEVDPIVEAGRIKEGPMRSDASYGHNGQFVLYMSRPHLRPVILAIQASDGEGWEHISVHVHKQRRCPTWEEMCFVKDLFFEEDEVVIQYHPMKSSYVNLHRWTLHLWKPIGFDLPIPPRNFV